MSRAPQPDTSGQHDAEHEREPGEPGATGGVGGRAPAAADPTKITSETVAERAERRRAWARGVVKDFPPWSDQQFREASAALGYRLKQRE